MPSSRRIITTLIAAIAFGAVLGFAAGRQAGFAEGYRTGVAHGAMQMFEEEGASR
jgi:hypothetical protein